MPIDQVSERDGPEIQIITMDQATQGSRSVYVDHRNINIDYYLSAILGFLSRANGNAKKTRSWNRLRICGSEYEQTFLSFSNYLNANTIMITASFLLLV